MQIADLLHHSNTAFRPTWQRNTALVNRQSAVLQHHWQITINLIETQDSRTRASVVYLAVYLNPYYKAIL